MKKRYLGIIITLISFIILLSLAMYNIKKVTNEVLKSIVETNIEVGDVKVNYLSVELKDVILKELDGTDIGKVDNIKVKINPFLPMRLSKGIADGGYLKIVQNKNGSLNVENIIKTTSNIKRISSIPNFTFKNFKVLYINKQTKKEIRKELFNVKGMANDLLETTYYLKIDGESIGAITKEKEHIEITLKKIPNVKSNIFSIFSFKNNDVKNKKDYMKFKFDNVDITKELAQLSPFDFISTNKSKINGYAEIIGTDEFYGNLDIDSKSLFYKDYSKEIKDSKFNVKMSGKEVNLSGKLNVDNQNVDLNLMYNVNNDNVEISLKSNDIKFDSLTKYKLLKSLDFGIKGSVNADFNISMNLGKETKKVEITKMKADIKSKELSYSNISVKDFGLSVDTKQDKTTKILSNFKILNQYIDIDSQLNLNLDLNKEKGNGSISLKNNRKEINIDSINAGIIINSFSDIIIGADDENVKLLAKLKDDIFSFDFSNKKDLIYTKDKIKLATKLNIKDLKYNLKDKKISGELKALANIFYEKEKIKIDLSSNVSNEKLSSNVNIETKGQILNVSGYTDKKLNHLYDIHGNIELLNILQLFGYDKREIKNKTIPLSINAKLTGNNKNISSVFVITSKNINYYAQAKDLVIAGKVSDILNNPKLNAKLNLGELWLSYHRLANIYADLDYNNSSININNIKNEFLNASIKYNLKEKNVELKGLLQNYMVYTTTKPDINVLLSTVDVRANGPLENINLDMYIGPSKVIMKDKYIGQLVADAKINNGNLDVLANLNENSIKLKYNIKTEDVDIDIKLLDELNKYVDIDDLNADIDSSIKVFGNIKNIKSNVDLKLYNIKYKQYDVPDMKVKAEYDGADIINILKTGKLKVNELSLVNKNKKEIYKTKFELDLANLNVDYEVKDKKFDLAELGKDYSGIVDFSAKVKGNFENFFVELALKSEEVNIQGNKITNVFLNGQANEKGININQGYLEYENNPVSIQGYVYFENSEYFLKVMAENFNLAFLNINKNISNASGLANINFVINNSNIEGNIYIDDFSITTNNYNIKNFNIKMDMLNNNIKIDKFKGNINGGIFDLSGTFAPPSIEKSNITLGKFDLSLNINKVLFKYHNNDIMLSTDTKFVGNNINSNIVINKANISNLSFLTKNNKNEKNDFISSKINSIIDSISKQITANIKLSIDNPVVLDIPSYLIVKNIQGQLLGEANIVYQNSKANIYGNFDADATTFQLNGNIFTIENLDIKFDGLTETGDIDPIINLKAVTEINGEAIEIFMNSRLSEKNIEYKSQSNKTKEEILSLLTLGNTKLNVSSIRSIGNNFVNIAAETAINQFISSITNVIGKKVGLTKFEINANIIDKEKLEFKDLLKNTSLDIVTQGKILKDKNIYWNASTSIPFDTKSNGIKYDVSLSYKITDGLDANLGIKSQDLGKSNVGTEKGIEKINFYTGVHYSNKFNDISEFTDKILEMFSKKEKLIEEREKNEK